MKEFVHLHNHTHYSILDSISTVKGLIKAAKADGQKALALTDHGVMFGTLEFYKECIAEGIKPILGVEAYIANNNHTDRNIEKVDANGNKQNRDYKHIILLAKNLDGYKNLMKLTSIANTEGMYYKPRIDEKLLERYSNGLIVSSACMGGVISKHIINGDLETAYSKAEYYKSIFGDDFYLELQDHFFPEDQIILREVPKIAKELNIKMICTNDVHYVKKEEALAHNTMLNIRDFNPNSKIDIHDLKYKAPEFYLKSKEEMFEIFKEFPEAIANTLEIVEKCDVKLDLSTNHMPAFTIPKESNAKDEAEYFEQLVWKGINERYETVTDEIRERAQFEIDTINRMKFPGYFLIVEDFIDAARKLGIAVGPGRGSAAGSIVAYALKITNIDPLKYGLLFERFLNPDRVSMPDIDIDFDDTRREEVINYVKNKYGENAVAQIVTFGKLSSKAVLTDVARILSIPVPEVKKITKLIPVKFGKVFKIEEALNKVDELKVYRDSEDEQMQQLLTLGQQLEDRNRNTGIHAAGIVIAPGDLTDYVPIFRPSKKNNDDNSGVEFATMYNMKNLEDAGLIKMDFLGLRTLSIIETTLKLIKENHGIDIDIDNISLNDRKTYDLISNGDTLSVFQFESAGMMDSLKKLKPDSLEELAAMNALFRPGPMDQIPTFIKRKFKKEPIELLHPSMEEELRETYGVIVYQEQVMRLSQTQAGFTKGQADTLRKAMGKKDTQALEKLRPMYIDGAVERNIPKETAEQIFNAFVKFGDYGFNKSHAIAYSFVAYQTAYLKAHYPAEFIAANMSAELNDQGKLVMLQDEAEKFGIKVVPPDVNKSHSYFKVEDNVIYFGMAGIKNVGISAVDSLVEVRKNGDFKNFFDFVCRVDNRLINKRALESLICAGAFDSIENGRRAQLMMAIEIALDYAKAMNDEDNSMDSLFGDAVQTGMVEPNLPITDEWDEDTKLKKEMEVLNFYISGHPLQKYTSLIKALNPMRINFLDGEDLSELITKSVVFFGQITNFQMRRTKAGKSFALLTLQDLSGKIECIVWNNVYEKLVAKLVKDEVLFVKGIYEKDENETKLIFQDAWTVPEVFSNIITGYNLWINYESKESVAQLEKLTKMQDSLYSESEIIFSFFDNENSIKSKYSAYLALDKSEKTLHNLEEIFGKQSVNYLANKEMIEPIVFKPRNY
jgi:DNA polymerase-3 subunit alpha